MEEIETIPGVHRVPVTFGDHVAYNFCRGLRFGFDKMSGYKEHMDANRWLIRCIT
jgi:hypothetical protein